MNMSKLDLSAVGVALFVVACTASDADPKADATTMSGDTDAATGTTGDTGDTGEPGEPTGDTDGPTTSTDTGPPEPPQTHVVIYEDCGFAPSCETLQVHIDTSPQEALECAMDLHADGLTGLVLAQIIPGGGPTYEPEFEHAIFFTADRQAIRQIRRRNCLDPLCESQTWEAWQGHELCEIHDQFDVWGLGPCVDVPDYSCAELHELWEQPPQPAVPCADRPEDDCQGPLSSQVDCFWDADFVVYPTDTCEPVAPAGACRENVFIQEPDCTLPPLCDGVTGDAVLFHDVGDGTVEIDNVFGCWIEEGYERCAWDDASNLVYGPAGCDCACG